MPLNMTIRSSKMRQECMGELILLWPEQALYCPARIAVAIETRERGVRRMIGRTCNLPATDGKWCEQHAYKAEILRVGEVASWPAASVNEHMTIGKGRDGWEAFAEICSRQRYEEFKLMLRRIEGTKETGISYMHPVAVLWQQELEAEQRPAISSTRN
jgi:hypothetical protein